MGNQLCSQHSCFRGLFEGADFGINLKVINNLQPLADEFLYDVWAGVTGGNALNQIRRFRVGSQGGAALVALNDSVVDSGEVDLSRTKSAIQNFTFCNLFM